MNPLNIPEEYLIFEDDTKLEYNFNLTIFTEDNYIKFSVDDLKTSLMCLDDGFVKRIQFENLNPFFLKRHLKKEIEIRNLLDSALSYIGREKYAKAIELLDDALYYDSSYGEALLYKSRALFAQKHFVKSLRHYKKAVKTDESLKDIEYHKLLLKKASEERDSFPKIKKNIYAGDEYFARGDFEKALISYDRALLNPTKFKDKIISKLLNKKATALLKLEKTTDALSCFRQSFEINSNDFANFNIGILEFKISNTVPDEFKKPLKISKNQLVKKAAILNEAGEFDLSLSCLDEYFENQFFINGCYIKALKLKSDVLKSLDKSDSNVEDMLKKLNV